MDSLSNLSVKLSEEDAAVFQTLQQSALLPSLSVPGEGDLVKLYKQRQRESQECVIEPYADILEAELLKYLKSRKEEILQKLKESSGTSFTADLFSWNSVSYRETLTELKRREGEMTPEQLEAHYSAIRSREARIKDEGWETTFGVRFIRPDDEEEDTWWTYHPVKVDRIFRFSDLAFRLSLALGPNFFPFTRWDVVKEGGEYVGDEAFWVYKKTLCVTYLPFGPNKGQMEKLLACAKKEAKRAAELSKTQLRRGDYAVGHGQLNLWPPLRAEAADEYADMPPLVAVRPAKRSQNACFCGCEDGENDDDGERTWSGPINSW
jgi:hypothetical protein